MIIFFYLNYTNVDFKPLKMSFLQCHVYIYLKVKWTLFIINPNKHKLSVKILWVMLFYEKIQTIEKLGIRFAKFERAVGFIWNKSKNISLLIKKILLCKHKRKKYILEIEYIYIYT